jgi:phosphoribosylformylglycinamidine cyclo-ligase
VTTSQDADKPYVSYADAGVNLTAADASVERIKGAVERTRRPEVLSGIGGFGGLFAFDATRYKKPVLVSGTDGVGTKVELARQVDQLDGLGHDLVAMVVDDLVVVGAEPLFFNDYIAIGSLDPDRLARLVESIADGCVIAGCALVGGETAEHPGLLAADAFDLAGFGVGVVDQDALLGPERVRDGDSIIAMASSGVHSNGFSLVRHIVAARDITAHHGFDRPLVEELLTPTKIYTTDCLALCDIVDVHAFCHITGGGIPGNLPRVLPDGLGAVVTIGSYEWPQIFRWLADNGPVRPDEMWRTFNCGVGMVAIVAPEHRQQTLAVLNDRGVDAWELGTVTSAHTDVRLV